MAFVEGAIVAGVVFVLLGSMGLFRKGEPSSEKKESVKIFSKRSNASTRKASSSSSSSSSSPKKSSSTKSTKSVKSSK